MGNTTVFSTGSALSAHHEIQLLKEQLEQQSQQTQAALAQLQLVREQLAAEQVNTFLSFRFSLKNFFFELLYLFFDVF